MASRPAAAPTATCRLGRDVGAARRVHGALADAAAQRVRGVDGARGARRGVRERGVAERDVRDAVARLGREQVVVRVDHRDVGRAAAAPGSGGLLAAEQVCRQLPERAYYS